MIRSAYDNLIDFDKRVKAIKLFKPDVSPTRQPHMEEKYIPPDPFQGMGVRESARMARMVDDSPKSAISRELPIQAWFTNSKLSHTDEHVFRGMLKDRKRDLQQSMKHRMTKGRAPPRIYMMPKSQVIFKLAYPFIFCASAFIIYKIVRPQ